ncbi:cilia- and flagella-associated protein 77 isoform X2 [Poecilia reticulata]|nr:PREDICTED: uncharacterized protein C9orf171 homolog isoform X2 [Poecilia reticulata]
MIASPRLGVFRESMLRDPLLIKAPLGRARSRGLTIPGPDFTYGASTMMKDGSVAEGKPRPLLTPDRTWSHWTGPEPVRNRVLVGPEICWTPEPRLGSGSELLLMSSPLQGVHQNRFQGSDQNRF